MRFFGGRRREDEVVDGGVDGVGVVVVGVGVFKVVGERWGMNEVGERVVEVEEGLWKLIDRGGVGKKVKKGEGEE